jgi:hypothetical protein
MLDEIVSALKVTSEEGQNHPEKGDEHNVRLEPE